LSPTRTFTFRSRPEAVSAARRALDGFDEVLDLGVFYDASLCVSELVTNAVIHAGVSEESELRLDVEIDGETLRVSVTDPGRGFDPPEPSSDDESGWGLYIVDRLSHRWGVDRSEGTQVWFEMAVNNRRPDTVDGEDADLVSADEPGETDVQREMRQREFPRLRLRTETAP
jgi:anti-sigma regulatory factor (Ser/Thr protein kinase)